MFLMNDRHLCCVCAVARFVGRAGRSTLTKTRPSAKADKPDRSQNRAPRPVGERAGLRPTLFGIVVVACSNPAPIYAVDIHRDPLTAVVYQTDLAGGGWTMNGASGRTSVALELRLDDGGSRLECRMAAWPPYSTGMDYIQLSRDNYRNANDLIKTTLLNKTLTVLANESRPYNACDQLEQAGRITLAFLSIGARGQQMFQYKLPIVPTIPGSNVSCSSETSVMNFGRINARDVSPTTTASINTTCSRDAAVSVTVNGGKPYLDSASGATISFATPIALTEKCKVCTTTVKGTMLTAPKIPGRYNWAVPVKIDYE